MRNISARISDEEYEKLALLARETERDISFHVRKAIDAYLNGDLVDFIIARDRLADVGDEEMTVDEMRKELGL